MPFATQIETLRRLRASSAIFRIRVKTMASPHFSQGQLRFEARVEDRRETMGTVAPKALIAIWF
jgi:hypothetical protein